MNEFNKENLKGIIKEAFQVLKERGEWYDIPSRKNYHDEDVSHRATEDQQDEEANRDELFADITAELMDEEGDEFKKRLIKALMTGDLLSDILDDIQSPEVKDLIFRQLGAQDDPFTES